GEGGDLLRNLDEPCGLAPDPDHRPLLETQLERIGDADGLHDPALDEPVRAGANGRLRHPQVRCDLRERPPAVLLAVLDDPLVALRDLPCGAATPGPGAALAWFGHRRSSPVHGAFAQFGRSGADASTPR